jgi:hypothetical protein
MIGVTQRISRGLVFNSQNLGLGVIYSPYQQYRLKDNPIGTGPVVVKGRASLAGALISSKASAFCSTNVTLAITSQGVGENNNAASALTETAAGYPAGGWLVKADVTRSGTLVRSREWLVIASISRGFLQGRARSQQEWTL